MDPDKDYAALTVGQARELADRAHMPQRICEDHFYQRIKLFVQQQASMGHYKCYYPVPGFTLGLPLYSVGELLGNLERRFRKEGWTARALGGGLELSWGTAYKPVLKSLDRLRARKF